MGQLQPGQDRENWGAELIHKKTSSRLSGWIVWYFEKRKKEEKNMAG